AAPVCRFLISLYTESDAARTVLLPANMDLLMSGALLAWLTEYHPESKILRLASSRWLLAGTGLLWFFLVVTRSTLGTEMLLAVFSKSFQAVLFFGLILVAASAPESLVVRVASPQVFRNLGKISYGIYLYH